MKLKYYLILVFVLVYSSNLNAQNNLNRITGLSSTSASVAYSLRQLSTSYTGPLVRIKVVNSFYDVYPDASTTKFSLSSKISAAIGTYDAAVATAGSNALSTIITGSTNATVAIWYDQSGNAVNVLSSTSTARIITSGSINTIFGQPTVYFFDNNSGLGSSSTVDYSALSGATVNAVAQNIATTSSYAGIIGTGATPITYPGYNIAYSSPSLGYGSDGNGCFYGTSVTSTDIKVVTNIFINTTTNLSKIYVNSVLKTNTAVTSGTCNLTHSSGSKIFIGASRGLGRNTPFIGNISEAILFPIQLSDAIRNSLETNQTQTYLGPSVTITSSASGAVCAGTSVTFTATTYNFTTPYYQWYANGTPISGATSSTYSSTNLTNGVQVYVKVNEGPFGGTVNSNGLLLNLDATNSSSYPGSGTTWNNLVTGNEVTNFTIQSAGTYSPDNGGVIRFGNSRIGAGASSSTGFSNLSAYTVEVWVKPAGTMGDYDPSVVGNTNYTPSFFAEKSSGGRVNMVLAYNARGLTSGTANNSYRYEAAINSGSWKPHQIATNYSSDLNNWVQIISTYDGSKLTIYRNGVSLGSSAALGISSLRTPSTGYWIAHRWDMNDGVYGDYSKVMMYNKALTSTEVMENYYAFNTRFAGAVGTGISSSSITTSVNASPSVPILTVLGDGCINKTTLSTPAGLTSYAWSKDNVIISGITTNSLIPNASGDYKVVVSNGSCLNTSSVTTIYSCGKTSEGKMSPITSSTTLVAISGKINSQYGVDERGLMLTRPLVTGTNPVTNGLELYLDATRSASYGGTGTTWTDISGQSNNASLTNPTFYTTPPANPNTDAPIFENGSFTFTLNKYALTTNSLNFSNATGTFIAWINPSQSVGSSNYAAIIFNRGVNSTTGLNLYTNKNSVGYHWNDVSSTYSWDSNLQVPNNEWSMIAVSIGPSSATAYLCKSSGITTATNTVSHPVTSGHKFYIACDPTRFALDRTFIGKMATAMVYSTTLTTANITAIFNAQKVAFGL